MRISDWSSDVCSSDLRPLTLNVIGVGNGLLPRQRILRRRRFHRAHIAGHAALGALGRNLERGAGEDRAARIKRRAGEEVAVPPRPEEHTSELQSLTRLSYPVFCLKKKNHY